MKALTVLWNSQKFARIVQAIEPVKAYGVLIIFGLVKTVTFWQCLSACALVSPSEAVDAT